MISRSKLPWLLPLTFIAPLAIAPLAARAAVPAPAVTPAAPVGDAAIVAVVNGDVITEADIDARARLFALSTGISIAEAGLDRLDAQIAQQLIDERLRLQEAAQQKITVTDQEIADQITDLNKRNGGNLRNTLVANSISMRTLIDQLRAQVAWTRVLQAEIGDRAEVTPAEVAARMAIEKSAEGQPEYQVAEIFVPVASPSAADAAKRFADTVIERLRSGAAFANVAAEFSQSEDALSGGEMGWVRPGDIDAAVAAVVTQMPEGAVSNPIRVPGGYAIVTLERKRIAGSDLVTVAKVRQAFFQFDTQLNPQAPTDQQKSMLLKAQQLAASAHDCAAVEAANVAAGSKQPSDPGDLPIERVTNPAMKRILTTLEPGKSSQPLVSTDGIVVMMVCSKTQQNVAQVSDEDMRNRIVNERVERFARSLQRDLQRQANIIRRGVAVIDDQG